jgi:hypothetical protein
LLIQERISPKVLAWSAAAALISLPICVVLFSYLFVDLGYMVIFARPYSHGYSLEEVFPDEELQVTCHGVRHEIPRKDLFFDPITVPFSVARYGPLTEAQDRSFGCTEGEVRLMKRSLLLAGFARHPLLHVRLAAEHFGKALVGAYFFSHVSYILRDRQDSWLAHYDALSYFSPYELILLEGYGKNGFRVQEKERPLTFVLNEFSASTGEPLVRAVAAGILGLCVIAGFIKGRLGELARDPINIGMSLLLFVYAYLVGLSAPFLYDRYTYVNLIVFCILAARIAAMTFGAKAGPAQS